MSLYKQCTKTSRIGLRFGSATILRISTQSGFTELLTVLGTLLRWASITIIWRVGEVQDMEVLVKVTPTMRTINIQIQEERLSKDVLYRSTEQAVKIYDINRFNEAFINIYKDIKMMVTLFRFDYISFLTPVWVGDFLRVEKKCLNSGRIYIF